MKEDFFISIMQKYGIENKAAIQNAYPVSYTHLTLPTKA